MNRTFQSHGENKRGGLYHLLLHLPWKISIRVGAQGRQIFPSGYYVYTGSARRGLAHRLARHLRKRKKRHWHIDFLTAVARVEMVLIDDTWRYTECRRHQAIMDQLGFPVIPHDPVDLPPSSYDPKRRQHAAARILNGLARFKTHCS